MAKLISALSKGAYNGATAYTVGDIITSSGSSYICIANSTGNAPPNASYWALLAQAGVDGVDGADGEVSLNGAQTLTNKTLTSPVLNTGLSGTAFLDEDDMASNSATKAASQQSIKAYVDTRVKPRTNTITSHATPTINTDTTDVFTITAQAEAITSMTTNLSGTPVNGQRLIIRILDNGTARAITWGASFASRGATLPTTTVLSKYVYIGLIYNSTASKWDCVAVSQEE